MNLHLPQTEEAKAEAIVLMGVSFSFSSRLRKILDGNLFGHVISRSYFAVEVQHGDAKKRGAAHRCNPGFHHR